MKKVMVFFVIFTFVLLAIPVGAANYPRVWDEADLLVDTDERQLVTQLTNISEKYQVDVVIVTVESTGELTPMEYADDFFDYNGFGFGDSRDGVLLLISMEERDWWISTRGYGITAFTDAGIEYIGEQILSDLSGGYYFDAFTKFGELCDQFIAAAKAGNPYDVGNLPKEPFNAVMALVISLFVGFIAAKFYTGNLKKELQSVQAQSEAKDYVRKGSMNVTESNDMFLYRRVDRRIKEQDNDSDSGGSSTHRSSSGASHGGGGGKF